MKTLWKPSLGVVLSLSACIALAQAPASPPAKPKLAKKALPTIPADPGERAFATNCIRCHNAPESLTPGITGTVVRHMRVRTNLSAEDERLIRGFLAP